MSHLSEYLHGNWVLGQIQFLAQDWEHTPLTLYPHISFNMQAYVGVGV